MTGGNVPAAPPPPLRRLVLASVGAFAVAALILFVAVLPAEYGIDPLGTGRLFGLMPAPLTPTPGEPAGPRPPVLPLSTDKTTLEIGPYDYVEYKYRLEQGDAMTFSWRATADVIHDFHADPDGGDDHDEVSFAAGSGREASGAHTAPMSGLHGWMWENPGATPITVTLATAGFYTAATEFRPNRRRIPHTIQPALE